MNETIDLLMSRCSVRSFSSKKITANELQVILSAGCQAPNVLNQQPWNFFALSGETLLAEMSELIKKNMVSSGIEFLTTMASKPGYSPTHGAPVVVLITSDSAADYYTISCALAAENIMIAAASLGIASCLIVNKAFLSALHGSEGVPLREKIGINDGDEIVCAVALGYAGGLTQNHIPRKKDVIHFVGETAD